jgi:hypothetical protein
MSWREMRGRLRDGYVAFACVMIVGGPALAILGKRPWSDAIIGVVLGGGILLLIRPWRASLHDAWVVRVEPEPDLAGGSFEPYFIPECKCGWDDPYYDDPHDARAAADKHAKGRVEREFRRRLEPVTD